MGGAAGMTVGAAGVGEGRCRSSGDAAYCLRVAGSTAGTE